MKKRVLALISIIIVMLLCVIIETNSFDNINEQTSSCTETTVMTDDETSVDIVEVTVVTEMTTDNNGSSQNKEVIYGDVVLLEYIPPFSGEPYVEVDSNIPSFKESEIITESFETYSQLDYLGRPGAAYVNVGNDLMPTEERGEIGQIKPAGWHTVKYDCIDGLYLYNRCHLIGYQLSGENDNINNLMTGTRYLNVEGMLYFENLVADYVTRTGNHVLYRVTPIYEEENLVATGVQMEGYSVEDNGKGICYNVFCYNVQPGVIIDYKTGGSYIENVTTESTNNSSTETSTEIEITADYIANKNTYKFHIPSCSSVIDMKEKNKWYYNGNRQDLIDIGYQPCGRCNP